MVIFAKAASVFSYTLGIEPSKKFYDICNEKKLNVKMYILITILNLPISLM